jgi:hypothetical protein
VRKLVAEGAMAEHRDPLRERELERRRQNEIKDLDTENDHSERPLEGFSAAPTTWTPEQDDAAAPQVHANDEAESQRRSLEQITPPPRPD